MATEREVTLKLGLKMGGTSALKDALVDITREIQRQGEQAAKLRALLGDSTLFQQHARAGGDLSLAKADYQEAMRKHALAEGQLVERAATSEEKRVSALRSLNEEMESLVQKRLRYNALLTEPGKLQDHAAATMALELEQANYEEGLRKQKLAQGQVVERATTPEERRIGALKSLNEETNALLQKQSRLNALLNEPGQLQGKVRAQLKTEGLEKQATFAESQERARQQGPLKAAADLLGLSGGGLSNMLSGFGGKLSGIGLSLGGKIGGALSGAGSFLGGAAAGPVGMAVAGAMALAPVVKSLASAPFNAVVGGMAAMNKALAGLNGSLGAVGSMLGAVEGVGSSMKGLGDKLGPLGIGFSVVGGAIEGLSQQLTAFLNTAVQLAAKAQPGRVKLLQLALDDTAATIGHRMVPIVELLTRVVRGLGDILNSVLPSTEEFRSALAPIGEAFEDFKSAMRPIAVIIKTNLSVGLSLLGDLLRGAATAIKVLTEPLGQLANFAGLKMTSTEGAAARSVSFQDTKAYLFSAYAAIGGSAGTDPSRKTADNTSRMVMVLQEIRDRLKGGEGGGNSGGTSGALEAALRFLRGF